MERSNEIRLKKIPLRAFLEALTDIYERGVDYIDIIGVPGQEQDSIGISVKEEYFASEEEDNDNDASFLSDDDINQLI